MNGRKEITGFPRLNSATKALFMPILLGLYLAAPSTAEAQMPPAQAQAPAPAAITPPLRSLSPDSATKILSPGPEARQAATSILLLVSNLSSVPANKDLVVNVPAYNFAAIIQELQNRKAKFVLPGAQAPSNARAVFTLQSDKAGLSQTVYLND